MTTVGAVKAHPPGVLIQPVVDPEQEKYRRMWEHREYRVVAPGEQVASEFLKQARPRPGDTVIDFGAGTGRGALMLALLGGMNVTMLDFAENCLDDDVRDMLLTQSHALRFKQADLRRPIGMAAKYGYCTDVMEHIDPAHVDGVLDNILKSAEHVFFQISTVDDACGALIGEPLHLTVKPYSWWLNKLREHDAVIHWSEENPTTALFYVTAWSSASELVAIGAINTGNDALIENIQSAVARGLTEARPYERQDTPIILLGGGPSLAQFEDEIRQKRADGAKLITTNGAYNWCLEHGITPSAQIIVDAREFNSRFVTPHVDTCKYLLASQCHPEVFDAAPEDQTILWHAAMNGPLCDELDRLYGDRPWYGVPGGSTVMLRALPLLRMLGYWRFEIYGFDSCLADTQHHAYTQPENDYERVVQVSAGGKVFACHSWMASQMQEFVDLMTRLAHEVELVVHGDGAIAHIIKTAAEPDQLELL